MGLQHYRLSTTRVPEAGAFMRMQKLAAAGFAVVISTKMGLESAGNQGTNQGVPLGKYQKISKS